MDLPPGVDLNKIPLLPAPEGQQSNFVDPPSIAGIAYGVISTLIALELIFLSVRLFNNVKSGNRLMADDWMAIAGFILSIGLAVCVLYMHDFATHFWNIPVTKYTPDIAKVIFAEEMLIGPAIFAGKTALLMMYFRIFSPRRSFRWKIYLTIAFTFLSTVLLIPVDAILCRPVDGDWSMPNPNCGGSYYYGLFQGTADIIVDLIALYLPIPEIIRLQMRLKKKIGILAIFATGIAAIVASGFNLSNRVYMYQNLDSGYAGYITTFCSFVETAIGVICASMPAMASMGKLHLLQHPVFASMRSRLLSYRSRSTLRDTTGQFDSNSKDSGSSHSRSNNSTSHKPVPRVQGTDIFPLSDISYPQGKVNTGIEVGVPEVGVDNAGIQRSVKVEQFSGRRE